MADQSIAFRAVVLSTVVILSSVAFGFTAVGTAVASSGNSDKTMCAPGESGGEGEGANNSDTLVHCPAIDNLSAEEVETDASDAEFAVDWTVSTNDSDALETVNLTLFDDTAGETEETVNLTVSGETVSNISRLAADEDDGSGHNYTVKLVATSGNGTSVKDTTRVTETEPPTIEGLSAEEVEDGTEDAAFAVDWNVSDSDGLDSVTLSLLNKTGDGTEEDASLGLSGTTANGTTWLNASGANNTGANYTVELTVNDTEGLTNSSSIDVSETGTEESESGSDDSNTPPTVDELSAADSPNAAFNVSWAVNDSDGNLAWVNLALLNGTENDPGDEVTDKSFNVSGSEASNATWLNATADDSTTNYTVDLTVNDTEGLSNTSTIPVNEIDSGNGDDTENETADGDDNDPPTVESLSAADSPNAAFNVSWAVNDTDGDLAWANLTLINGTDGAAEDTAKNSVSGSVAGGTSWLNGTDDASTTNYTVELVVTDENGTSASATTLVNETEEDTADDGSENDTDSPNAAPTVESLSAEDRPDANFSVSWAVDDTDENLDWVNLTLADDTDDTEDAANLTVSGSDANGTTWLNATVNDATTNYTVELVVEDTEGLTNTSSIPVNETESRGDEIENAPPAVERLSANEVETADQNATFAVNWTVNDGDGNLAVLDLTLHDRTDGGVEDNAPSNVSGETASNTTRLVAPGDNGSGHNYTVELVVTDERGANATQSVSVSAEGIETDETEVGSGTDEPEGNPDLGGGGGGGGIGGGGGDGDTTDGDEGDSDGDAGGGAGGAGESDEDDATGGGADGGEGDAGGAEGSDGGDGGAGGGDDDADDSDDEEGPEGEVSDGLPDEQSFQFGGNLMIVGATLALLALLLLLLLAARRLAER